MNSKQREVLIIAVLLFSLSELFPPWLYEDTLTSIERSAGYHFILSSAPEVKPYPEMRQIFLIPDGEPEHGFSVRKDLARLYGQRFIIFFLMLGFLLLLDDRKSFLRRGFAWASISIGVSFLGLYILYISRYF